VSLSSVRRTLRAVSFWLLLLAGTARAAQPSPSPVPTGIPEIGHVVTADRRDEPISKTSRPTYVIDRAAILATGAHTVAEALADVPGVQLFSYGAFGAESSYGLLGATTEETLVLLDGEPIAAASVGTIDLGTFSTVGVSRIEVVESGASTLYGTSAVGGVINIITGIPRGTYLALSAGSLGDRDARVAVGTGDVGIAFERHTASNVFAYPSVDGNEPGVRQNDDAQQSVGRITYERALGSRWDLRTSLGAGEIQIGVPGMVPAIGSTYDTLTPDARQHTSSDDLRAVLSHDGDASTFTVTAAASRQDLAYADPQSAVPGYGDESDTYDARTQLSMRDDVTIGRATLISGVDLSRESAFLSLGPDAAPPAPSAPPLAPFVSAALSQSAAYTEYQIGLGKATTLNLGLRAEHDSPYGSILAPAIGAVVRAGPLRLTANADETYRVPTIDELYYPGFGNPALQPEKLRTIDFTASTDAVLGGASLGFFDRYADDLIYYTATTPENAQLASLRGLVASIRTRPMTGVVTSLSVTNLFRAIDLTPQNYGDRLPYEPAFQVALQVQKPVSLSRMGFGVDFRTTGGHLEPYAPVPVSGYTDVDAYVRAYVSRGLVLSLRGSNIGDEAYEGLYGYPAPGRRIDVELATQ